MKISANSVKNGNILEYNSELYRVAKQPEHVKPGKGPAYIQVEMKNLKTGNKVNVRFNSSDNVEKAALDQQEYQYLYTENKRLFLMNNENFEQLEIDEGILGEKAAFLSEGMIITLESHNEVPLNVTLPQYVLCEIVETQPHIKGSTVTSSFKPAILTNGLRVMVPPYIETGEKIKIKTEDSTFVERAK